MGYESWVWVMGRGTGYKIPANQIEHRSSSTHRSGSVQASRKVRPKPSDAAIAKVNGWSTLQLKRVHERGGGALSMRDKQVLRPTLGPAVSGLVAVDYTWPGSKPVLASPRGSI